MNIINSSTARLSNFKRNLFNLNKKDKINNLKTDVIMNNTVKVRRNNNFNFLNNKGDLKCENKRGKKFYNKENDNKNRKIWIANLDKYYKKKKKLNFDFFNY